MTTLDYLEIALLCSTAITAIAAIPAIRRQYIREETFRALPDSLHHERHTTDGVLARYQMLSARTYAEELRIKEAQSAAREAKESRPPRRIDAYSSVAAFASIRADLDPRDLGYDLYTEQTGAMYFKSLATPRTPLAEVPLAQQLKFDITRGYLLLRSVRLLRNPFRAE